MEGVDGFYQWVSMFYFLCLLDWESVHSLQPLLDYNLYYTKSYCPTKRCGTISILLDVVAGF